LWRHRNFPRSIVLKSSPICEPFSHVIQTTVLSAPRETYQPGGGTKLYCCNDIIYQHMLHDQPRMSKTSCTVILVLKNALRFLCAIVMSKLVTYYEKFGGNCCHYVQITHLYSEDGDSRVFRKAGVTLQDYTFPYGQSM
jgi:hypothetical protein